MRVTAYTSDRSTAGKPLRIGFILARSFTLSAFALFIDTLRLASDELDRSGRVFADWQVIASHRNLISSSCGVQVAPTSSFVDPQCFDYIVVVGGLLSEECPVDRETFVYLKAAAARQVPLIGVCTGTFILAEAGLMRRHRTCVSWLHYQAFVDRFPNHRASAESLFNLDDLRGSCAGGSSSADLAALIVRRHISAQAEKNALEVLQIEKARSSYDIQPRRPLGIKTNDPRLRAALILMENHLEERLTVAQLASAIRVGRRQLERLFRTKANCSPVEAYDRLRMERAKHLVTNGRMPLIEIALEVGISNASQFTRTFKRVHGQTPGRLRVLSGQVRIHPSATFPIAQ